LEQVTQNAQWFNVLLYPPGNICTDCQTNRLQKLSEEISSIYTIFYI